MKKLTVLFLLFVVTGGYNVHYPRSHGLQTARRFTETVHAESRAHAANQVLFALKSYTRRGFYIESIKEVSQ